MKPKSKIEKGKRAEKFVAKEIMEMGLGLATKEPGSGSGKRKGDIFSNLPFLLEVKNWDKYDINRWIDQAKKQAEVGNWDRDKWALIFRDFRTPETNSNYYAIIDFWQFLKLLKKHSEPLIKKPDQELKWLLLRLKDTINQIVKKL